MPRANPLQPAFNAGELSLRLSARVDFAKYPAAVALLENLLPLVEGGVTRRPGSRFAVEVKASANFTTLIDFEHSVEQAYQVETGDRYFRFIKDQGQITANDINASITNGDFPSNITDWDDRSTGTASIAHDATLGRLNLVGAAASIAWAEQDVVDTTLNVASVLQFEVYGVAGDTIELRIGDATLGTEVVNDVVFGVGFHCFEFTPTVSPFFMAFRNNAAKTIAIDNVALIDNVAIEISSPYLQADLFDASNRLLLNRTQSADVAYLVHELYASHKLTRTGHTSWSLTEIDFIDGPYLDENTTATTLNPSAATGLGITITASAIKGINGNRGFLSTDVGRLIRIDNPASGVDWGYAKITAVASTLSVTADVKRDFATANADANWALGSWSGTTGYPRVVTFHEQRLVFFANTDQPQTKWYSQTADFENMTPDSDPTTAGVFDGTVENDDALDFTISSDQVNAIRWAQSAAGGLLIGTKGAEWVVTSDGPIVTPTDIEVNRHTKRGSSIVPGLLIDNAVIFVKRSGRRLHEFAFSFEADGFRAPDMTKLAKQVTKGGIIGMAYQEEPDSILWCPRKDGQIATLTRHRDEDVIGWGRQILGGSFGAGDAVVEAVSTNPGTNGTGQVFDSTERDEVWLIVKRTIDSVTKRYIEFPERPFQTEDGHAQWDAFYVDSGLTLDKWNTTTTKTLTLTPATAGAFADGDTGTLKSTGHAPFLSGDINDVWELAVDDKKVQVKITAFTNGFTVTVEFLQAVPRLVQSAATSDWLDPDDKFTTITGLTHLEGETVKINVDGGTHPDRTVSSGSITLQAPAGIAQVGLGYKHRLNTLKLNAGAAAGTAIGKTKRIAGVTMLLLDSMAATLGPDADNLEPEVDFREVGDPMDIAAPLFTGEHFFEIDADYETDARMYLESDLPVPFTLLALAPEMRTNENM